MTMGEGGPSAKDMDLPEEDTEVGEKNAPDQDGSSPEAGAESEGNVIVQETYNGEGDPWAFLEGIAAQAREQGYDVTAQEILSQLEAQAEQEGDFSFDTMGTSSIENLITPGTTIIIKEVTVLEPVEARGGGEDKAESAVEDEESPESEEPSELGGEDVDQASAGRESRERRKTSLGELREVFESTEGQELNSHLLKIKESGQALMTELPNCKDEDESAKTKDFKSTLLDDLGAAEKLERELNTRISEEFGVDLGKELVPSHKILACVKNGYKRNRVTMTEQAEVFDRVSASGGKLTDVVESAGRGV